MVINRDLRDAIQRCANTNEMQKLFENLISWFNTLILYKLIKYFIINLNMNDGSEHDSHGES